MIFRDGRDEYRIQTMGEKEPIILAQGALLDRLRGSGIWSEDHLQDILALDTGDATPTPRAVYIRSDGTITASVGGVAKS